MMKNNTLRMHYNNYVRKNCFYLNPKQIALISAIYTLNTSILALIFYCWRISINIKQYDSLGDIYYGVQISYFAIVFTHFFMIFLSIILIFGIHRENISFVIPWILGCITFISLEAISLVYSNVLRDHINKQFDLTFKVEITFFTIRTLANIGVLANVMRFSNLIRNGISWKILQIFEL